MSVALLPLTGAFLVIALGLLAVKIWALVDCIIRPAPAFEAASKQTKGLWLGLLVGTILLSTLGLFILIGLVVAIVYLVDVRPAVRAYGPGPRTGPYGY